jgi:calcium-dependent protein kinase
MLMKKPKDRLTAEEVLNHPWVREDGDAPATKIEDEVLSRMKNFSAMNKFKKLGLMAMARTMTKEEILGLKELFQSFDEDGSGTVTIKEFQKGLAKKGTSTTAAEVQQLLNTIDVDASGEIDYQEFIASTLSAAKFNSEENIARAFAYFDTDNSGYITVDELKKVIKENNVDVDATNFLDEVDKNNDGRVDYDEFLAMMTKEDKPKIR